MNNYHYLIINCIVKLPKIHCDNINVGNSSCRSSGSVDPLYALQKKIVHLNIAELKGGNFSLENKNNFADAFIDT